MDTKIQVLSTIEAMTRAFHEGDIDAIMSTYEPAAVVVAEPSVPVQGDGPLRAMFANFVAAKAHFTFDAHEVFVAGDLALHLVPWKMTGISPERSPIDGAGLSIAVLRRQPDGSWRLVIDNPYGDVGLEHAFRGAASDGAAP